jgi:tetratricopeptide (TPR) repeat protein
MIWPGGLAVFYPHPGGDLAVRQAVGAAGVLLVTSVLVICFARRYRYLLVGWLWFLGTMVPVIGVVQVGLQGMADRYTYVPLIGIFVMIAWGISEVSARWHYRKVLLGIGSVAILGVLLICTRAQVRYWQNDLALYGHSIDVTKNNYIMHNNLGIAYGAQGRVDEAIDQFRKAVKIKPGYAEAYYNMGFAFKLQDNLDKAIDCFSRALEIKPDYADAHNNLGLALRLKGNVAEAIEHFRKSIDFDADNYRAHYNLAQALRLQGDSDEAIIHYRKVLQINPAHTESRNALDEMLKSVK